MGDPLIVIFNRHALGARVLRRAGLAEALRERELEFEIIDERSSGEAREAARTAAAEARTVIAAGGDGTIRDVLNGVMAAGRPECVMGVIPLGTGNDTARALGRVGRGLEDALDALVQPRVVAIDVAQVNGDEYFINVLGIGFDAEVARSRASQSVRFPGYFPSVARTMLYYRPRSYRVSWPEGSLEGEAHMVAAMNGPCEGGGFRLAPDARIEDGLLDIYWIDPIDLWQFARYVWSVRRGTHGDLPIVKRFRTAELAVESESPIQYHVDGEYRELPAGYSLEVVLHPRRLRMIV